MKTLVVPALLVLVTLASGFTTLQSRGRVIKTSDGVWIIPADVSMSQGDVQRVVEIAKSGADSAAVAYHDRRGSLQIEGDYCLKDFRQMSREYKVDLDPTRGTALRGWFWKRKTFTDAHFQESSIGGSLKIKELDEKLEPILRKYMARSR
jgi:hypothetical protein